MRKFYQTLSSLKKEFYQPINETNYPQGVKDFAVSLDIIKLVYAEISKNQEKYFAKNDERKQNLLMNDVRLRTNGEKFIPVPQTFHAASYNKFSNTK